MEVQIAPNWADIEGAVAAVEAAKERPGFLALTIELRTVRPVDGFLCMVDKGDRRIEVLIPADLARDLKLAAGDRLACRVRRGGPQKIYFVHREHVRRLGHH